MIAKRELPSSNISVESPGRAISAPGSRYSSGPGPFLPICRTVPVRKSATESTSSVQSVTSTRPSGSSRRPRIRLNSWGSTAGDSRRTGAGGDWARARRSASEPRAMGDGPVRGSPEDAWDRRLDAGPARNQGFTSPYISTCGTSSSSSQVPST